MCPLLLRAVLEKSCERLQGMQMLPNAGPGEAEQEQVLGGRHTRMQTAASLVRASVDKPLLSVLSSFVIQATG